MIDTSVLVDNLVTILQDIPELLVEMAGDPARIFAYHDQYPKKVSLTHAIHSMPAPSIMAAWQGTGPGTFGGFDVWKHQVTLFVRARETVDGDEHRHAYNDQMIPVRVLVSLACAASALSAQDNPVIFRITPVRPVAELRAEAISATPPTEAGPFRPADLVDLAGLDPRIKLEIRYATRDNFLSTPVYTQARAFLQRPAAEALLRAHRALLQQGYGRAGTAPAGGQARHRPGAPCR